MTHERELLGLDRDVDRVALGGPVRLVQEDAAVGVGGALPGAPAHSRNCAIEAAKPMQTVATSHRSACMVS